VYICVPPKTKEQDIMLRQLKYIIKHKGGGGKEWKIRPNRSKKLCIKLERIFFWLLLLCSFRVSSHTALAN
jgi:hypothetical protein